MLVRSGLSVRDVHFIETYGAGTRTGDVIEATSFRHVFGRKVAGSERVAVSPVKSVTDHLDVAAGLSGLLKAVFQVWQGRISGSQLCRADSRGLLQKHAPVCTGCSLAAVSSHRYCQFAGGGWFSLYHDPAIATGASGDTVVCLENCDWG